MPGLCRVSGRSNGYRAFRRKRQLRRSRDRLRSGALLACAVGQLRQADGHHEGDSAFAALLPPAPRLPRGSSSLPALMWSELVEFGGGPAFRAAISRRRPGREGIILGNPPDPRFCNRYHARREAGGEGREAAGAGPEQHRRVTGPGGGGQRVDAAPFNGSLTRVMITAVHLSAVACRELAHECIEGPTQLNYRSPARDLRRYA